MHGPIRRERLPLSIMGTSASSYPPAQGEPQSQRDDTHRAISADSGNMPNASGSASTSSVLVTTTGTSLKTDFYSSTGAVAPPSHGACGHADASLSAPPVRSTTFTTSSENVRVSATSSQSAWLFETYASSAHACSQLAGLLRGIESVRSERDRWRRKFQEERLKTVEARYALFADQWCVEAVSARSPGVGRARLPTGDNENDRELQSIDKVGARDREDAAAIVTEKEMDTTRNKRPGPGRRALLQLYLQEWRGIASVSKWRRRIGTVSSCAQARAETERAAVLQENSDAFDEEVAELERCFCEAQAGLETVLAEQDAALRKLKRELRHKTEAAREKIDLLQEVGNRLGVEVPRSFHPDSSSGRPQTETESRPSGDGGDDTRPAAAEDAGMQVEPAADVGEQIQKPFQKEIKNAQLLAQLPTIPEGDRLRSEVESEYQDQEERASEGGRTEQGPPREADAAEDASPSPSPTTSESKDQTQVLARLRDLLRDVEACPGPPPPPMQKEMTITGSTSVGVLPPATIRVRRKVVDRTKRLEMPACLVGPPFVKGAIGFSLLAGTRNRAGGGARAYWSGLGSGSE